MTEIIEKWLRNCLGLTANMEPSKFAYFVMDGTVIAKLLHKYNIISDDELITIFPTDSRIVAFRNLQYISNWLKAAGIHFSNEYLLEISTGKSTSAVKLFYELYLALHDKDKFDFIVQFKAKQKRCVPNAKFVLSHVPEEIPDPSDVPDNVLSKQLVEHSGEMQWSIDRYQHIIDQYEEMRERHSEYIREEFGPQYREKFCGADNEIMQNIDCTSRAASVSENQTNLKLECRSQHFTYDKLKTQAVAAKNKPRYIPDPEEGKRIVNMITQKHRSEKADKESMMHQQRMLLIDMWSKTLALQENEFEQSVTATLLKQSDYEKQMSTKMFEIRQQKQHILQNRRFVNEETMQKREEEFLEDVFLREKKTADKKFNYYLEKSRVLELHKKLYNRKRQLKTERNYNMCLDVVTNMVDVALKHAEYKETYSEEVPERVRHESLNLFIKQQSIFDLVDDVVDIVSDTADLPVEIEEIYCLEIDRQDQLDERDFENYHSCNYPWMLKDLLLDTYDYKTCLKSIEMAMNILGHNVQRVLLTKYPEPMPPPPPDIHRGSVAACVNGIADPSILPALQKLLNKQGIRVIDLQEAINYCMHTYQTENVIESTDTAPIEEETTAVLEKIEKPKKEKNTKPPKKGDKNVKANRAVKPDVSETNMKQSIVAEKQCQTPKVYPCEEVSLSVAGELGKTAYDILSVGEGLTDNLIVDMFVEFLKTLTNINGWVLINYPTTLKQAVLLETALTGISVPPSLQMSQAEESDSLWDISDLKYRDSACESESHQKRLRTSQILPNPIPQREEPYYDTYLTAFIDVKQGSVDEFQDEEQSPLCHFYSDQGCNYAFYLKVFELAAIKHLAKLVLGEFTLPPKSSLELFGDTVLYLEADTGQGQATSGKETKSKKQGEKKEKPAKPVKREKIQEEPKPEEAKKGKPSKKGGKKENVVTIVAVVCADKETQIPEPNLVYDEVYIEPPPEPRAGESAWQYAACSIPTKIEQALATFWENTEKVYLTDFKQTFFIKRVIISAFMPYLNNIKTYVENFLKRPDNKQVYMNQFQTLYNAIDADMRDDDELKAEIHCRIAEFREKLWEICDQRMRESESLRQTILTDNWVSKQLLELINNCICETQLECDRCASSLQFLADFYSGIITKKPSTESLLESIIGLTAPTRSSSMVVPNEANTSIGRLLTVRDLDPVSTPFHEMLQTNLKTCLLAIDKWHTTSLNNWSKMDSYFKPTLAKKDKGHAQKSDTKKDKNSKKLLKMEEPEPDVKEEGPRLIEEWGTAINGEIQRAKLRVNLLIAKGFVDLDDCLNTSRRIFYYLFDAINERYRKEMQSVDTACELLAKAVEAEVPIQPQLVLNGDEFYITPEILMFPEELPPADPPTTESKSGIMFTIEQLSDFTAILMDMAPNASIIERAFVYLLQDMIVHNAEDGKEPLVPEVWQTLQPKQVILLAKELFGNAEFIDWKDFIIQSMCLTYPNEEELLNIRDEFREYDPDSLETIKDYQFYTTRLWFEDDFDQKKPEEMLRLKLTKELLFKLFCIDSDTINYTALLLAFCKDVDLAKSVAKALAVSLGKPVCWDFSEGAHYVASVLNHRQIDDEDKVYRELSRIEAAQDCASTLNTIIGDTVHKCDSVVITECKSESDVYVVSDTKHERSAVDLEFLQFSEDFECDSIGCEEFSNVDVAYEPSYYRAKVYYLLFETLLTVLIAALPWHLQEYTLEDTSFRNRLEKVYDSLKDPEFNNSVLSHQLLNDSEFKKIISNINKFRIIDPSQIVAEIIRDS